MSKKAAASKVNAAEVERLQLFTGASKTQATAYLERHGGNVELAANAIFEDGVVPETTATSASTSNKKKAPTADSNKQLSAWFKSMEDAPDVMNVDGLIKFCAEIQVDPEDVIMLVIAYKMDASKMYTFTKEEFIHGMHSIGASNKQELIKAIPALRLLLKDKKEFDLIYSFCYKYALEGGQKMLTKDVAVALWRLLLTERFPAFAKEWCDFVEKDKKKGVSNDLYLQVLRFAEKVGLDLEKYDADQAWPTAIDEFVEFRKEQQ